jgi:hypothetical protein
MQTQFCEAPGCSAHAAFRQMEPVNLASPLYLCVQHWNEFRIIYPDQASMYGSLKLLGPLELDPRPNCQGG